MHDLLVPTAGILAMAAAIIHGVLGETKIFTKARIEPQSLRLLIRLVWQCSAVAWFSLGGLLVASPWIASQSASRWIIAASALTFGFAAIANAWATRGRHFGWIVLLAVTGLSLAGL
ncbi:hypothetical protein HB779_11585 [Phyllobacterium sp. 628]|uniref:hypothetical protein n=1 Tax=Phyllobacterium sp. 628 TaxID=2718938 RepID=UPI001662261E|nr:hypothetical protein [Phyllobacterium sp. 628]QND52471.1 hypothetical protein HB779_11585 [Phyllobacterium sp. 628]